MARKQRGDALAHRFFGAKNLRGTLLDMLDITNHDGLCDCDTGKNSLNFFWVRSCLKLKETSVHFPDPMLQLCGSRRDIILVLSCKRTFVSCKMLQKSGEHISTSIEKPIYNCLQVNLSMHNR